MTQIRSFLQEKGHFLDYFIQSWRFQRIVNYIPPKSVVLDMGCGFDARLLRKIEHKISKGFGLDFSVNPGANSEKINLRVHDLNHPLPFENEYFNIVVSLANLEHLIDPNKCFHEILRVLRPGGALLLTAPSTYGKPVLEFMAYRLKIADEAEVRDHKQYFNKPKLLKLARDTGFSESRHRYFQFFMNNFLHAKK